MMDTSERLALRASPLDALSIGYVKILKVFLSISASWPYQIAGGKVHPAYKLYGRIFMLVGFTATFGEIFFLIENSKILPFFELGHMYLTCFIAILGVVRMLLPLHPKYGAMVEQFLLSFHLIHLKHKSRFHHKVFEKFELLSGRVVVITMALTMLSGAVFNMIPIMSNISSGAYKDANKTIELAVFFSYPGFNARDHYKLVTVLNFYLVAAFSILISGIDLIITLFVINIIGHIVILHNTLNTFPIPQNKENVFKTESGRINKPAILTTMFTVDENLIIKDTIKQCVEHHLFIVRFTDEMSEFFGPVIAFYYLFHQVSGCVLLLELSAGGVAAFMKYGALAVIIFAQLIVISVIFEIVNTKSAQLAEAAYAVPWESMSVSNQRSVCLLLRRLQTPITVSALGITSVNVNTMTTILKTSFSYFTFLRTLND